jgi:hypothetical protein
MKMNRETKITRTLGTDECTTLTYEEYKDFVTYTNELAAKVKEFRTDKEELNQATLWRCTSLKDDKTLMTVFYSSYNNTLHIHVFPAFEEFFNIIL